MIRRIAGMGGMLLVVSLAGCSSDPREVLIVNAIELIKNASNEIGTIKGHVDEAIKKAENQKLNVQKLKDANGAIESLRDLGKQMQKVKQRTDAAAATTTDEEKVDLRDRFKSKLNNALTDLEEQRVELQKSLDAAEKLDPDGIRDLRDQLTNAEGTFAMLSRQR